MASRQHPSDTSARLEPVVAEALAELGFELDSLHVRQVGARNLVKVVADAEDGVDLDGVARASRAVSKALDKHDHVLAGSYTLEVTSPGVDRPLTRPRHWRRAWSRLVRLRMTDGTQCDARVGHAAEDGVTLLVDGAVRKVGYAEIASARVEVEFRGPPEAELALLSEHAAGGRGSTGDAGGTGGMDGTDGPPAGGMKEEPK